MKAKGEMNMNISKDWLENKGACVEGMSWFNEKYNHEVDSNCLFDTLIEDGEIQWANWLIVNLLSKENCIKYAIYAAELALPVFEKVHPKDDRPRIAIDCAKNCIETKATEAVEVVAGARMAEAIAVTKAVASWINMLSCGAKVARGTLAAARSAVAAARSAVAANNEVRAIESAWAAETASAAAASASIVARWAANYNKTLITIINYGRSLQSHEKMYFNGC